MIFAAVGTLAVVAITSADVFSNHFFDRILLGVSQEIRSGGFDDLGVNGFEVKVDRTGLLNRDFKATFSRGGLIGLSTAVRDGECNREQSHDDNRISCDIIMPHARFTFDAMVKGDDITGRSHFIATTTYLTNVRAEITVEGKLNNNARFSNLIVKSSCPLETSIVRGKVNLNSARRHSFISKINENISRQVGEVLRRQYTQLLRIVVPRFII